MSAPIRQKNEIRSWIAHVTKSANAFLVPLNGVRSAEQLSEGSLTRIEKLLAVWDRRSWIVLSTGLNTHKPPVLNAAGFPVTESRVAAREILARGVPRSKILTEETSSDTIGNIYFAMLQFIQPLAISAISVVTSRFHMERTRAAAEWVCSLDGWATVPVLRFETAEDPAMLEDVRRLLEEKEAAGVANIARMRHEVTSVADMCLWLQMQHQAYRFDGRVDDLPAALLQMY